MSKIKSLYSVKHSFLEYFTLPSVIGIALIAIYGIWSSGLTNSYINSALDYSPMLNGKTPQTIYAAILSSEDEFFYFVIAVFLICGIVMGISQFEFLHNKAHRSAVMSFGEKRKRIFLTRTIPVLSAAFVLMLISFLPLFLKNASAYGFSKVLVTAFSSLVLTYFAIVVVGFAVGVIGSLLCAKTLETGAFAVAAATLPCIIKTVIISISKNKLFGFSRESIEFSAIGKFLNPLFLFDVSEDSGNRGYGKSYPEMFSNITDDTVFLPEMRLIIIAAVYWLAVSAIALTICLYIFEKKYKPEKAVKTRNSSAELITISAACMPLLFFIFMLNASGASQLSVFEFSSVIMSAIIVFAGLMIIYRDKKAIKKCAITVISQGAVFVAIILICTFNGLGFENRMPDASKISCVEVYGTDLPSVIPSENYEMYNEPDIASANSLSWLFNYESDFELIRSINKSAAENRDGDTNSKFTVTYYLKNGGRVTRTYKNLDTATRKEILKLFDTKAIKTVYNDMFTNGLVPVSAGEYRQEAAFLPDKGVPGLFLYRNDMSREYLNARLEKQDLERIYKKLLVALADDYAVMSYEDMYYSSERQLCSISILGKVIGDSGDKEDTSVRWGTYDFPVFPSMKNTVEVLKSEGLLKYCSDTLTPVSVRLFRVNDYLSITGIYAEKNAAKIVFKSCEMQNTDITSALDIVKEYSDKKSVADVYSKCKSVAVVDENSLLAVVQFSGGKSGVYVTDTGVLK